MLKKKSIFNHLWELKRPLTVRLDHYRPPDPVTVNRNLTSCCHSVRPRLSSGCPLVPFIGESEPSTASRTQFETRGEEGRNGPAFYVTGLSFACQR